ncbi:MAG TPA: prolyl oligopeptidase family serine peptidase [Anaerolineales bacterium]|nr:prolyl oligopeptidase family serine peptidase [Anaerolineales bacterium]
MLSQMKNYPPLSATDVRVLMQRKEEGYERKLLVFQTPFGYRRMAELFVPEEQGTHPLILFLHWYEPEARDSNRSQFVEEAIEMAKAGAICLTVETLWSDPDFFLKRTQADDMQNSMEEVVNERRFIDFLASQPNADLTRFALVGHDFGGMYGILAGSLDQHPTHYVVMAATPRFPDWYLYLPKLEGAAREAFLSEMSAIDPITHIPNLASVPVFFQFGDNDPHVPLERADEFFAAAKEPKEKKVYQSGHGLNDESTKDRKAWLKEKLQLGS